MHADITQENNLYSPRARTSKKNTIKVSTYHEFSAHGQSHVNRYDEKF